MCVLHFAPGALGIWDPTGHGTIVVNSARFGRINQNHLVQLGYQSEQPSCSARSEIWTCSVKICIYNFKSVDQSDQYSQFNSCKNPNFINKSTLIRAIGKNSRVSSSSPLFFPFIFVSCEWEGILGKTSHMLSLIVFN